MTDDPNDEPNGEMPYMDISLPMKLIAMVEEDERNQGNVQGGRPFKRCSRRYQENPRNKERPSA